MGKKKQPGWPKINLVEDGRPKDELFATIAGRAVAADVVKGMGDTARKVFLDAGILVSTQDNWRIGEMETLTLRRLCRVAKDAEKAVRAAGEDVDAVKALFDPIRSEIRWALRGRKDPNVEARKQLRRTLEGLEFDTHIYRGH